MLELSMGDVKFIKTLYELKEVCCGKKYGK